MMSVRFPTIITCVRLVQPNFFYMQQCETCIIVTINAIVFRSCTSAQCTEKISCILVALIASEDVCQVAAHITASGVCNYTCSFVHESACEDA